MIVSRGGFHDVLAKLSVESRLAVDTETSGLRMYHGDRLFSIIIASASEIFYFNFIPYEDVAPALVLPFSYLPVMGELLFSKETITWYIQNAANFDLCMFGVDGIEIAGPIHCTKAIGRVEYNDHMSYSLENQLSRLGRHKDDAVKAYIKEHRLWTEIPIPGKEDPYRVLHYDRVPFDIIVPYGETDGRETFFLGDYQEKSIAKKDLEGNPRSLRAVLENEKRLQKTIYRMKHRGVRINIPYCKKAATYESDRGAKAALEFKKLTGVEYAASPKLFAEVFASEKDKWEYTEKGNPSFESDILKKFNSPAASQVLTIRDAKSKADFYNGFLWFSDAEGVVHPNYNPEGATHGRFSSSEPNFQNLTSEDSEEELNQEFVVRRALLPRKGFVFIMPDYDQMEYKFMLENACRIMGHETELAKMVVGGFDFHEATCVMAKSVGSEVVRKQAKVANFLTLYGGGPKKLAESLNISIEEAKKIRGAIFKAAPEIENYLMAISSSAEKFGYITNWLGRRCYFPNKKFSYRAPNYHTSGGCADVVKVAMNQVDEFLLDKKSKMVMTVHDELPIEVHESELETVPHIIKDIMENVYKSQYIPLTTGMEWSAKSLGDKIKGFPISRGLK